MQIYYTLKGSMHDTVQTMLTPGKGLLALDWSEKSITTKFSEVGVASTPETHRVYRQMLVASSGIENYISGIIFNEETVKQSTDEGKSFSEYVAAKGIIPGVKVDKGGESFNGGEEEVTKGIEDLDLRLKEFIPMGIKFTKWRAVFKITDTFPSKEFLEENLNRLTRYAEISIANGLVPVVEPEVSMKGNHTTTRCAEITEQVLKIFFSKLKEKNVDLGSIVLKTNMVVPGQDSGVSAEPIEVAEATLRTFKRSVPPDLPGIVFLSGGQSPDEATINLNEIIKRKADAPWDLSFSFARALQGEALKAWSGKEENVSKAQKEFITRLEKVASARKGEL